MQRFTAVHIQSVQSHLFHHRVQKNQESVDQYAQELRKLFKRAYPGLDKAKDQEGESVLTSRFVAGLQVSLQD